MLKTILFASIEKIYDNTLSVKHSLEHKKFLGSILSYQDHKILQNKNTKIWVEIKIHYWKVTPTLKANPKAPTASQINKPLVEPCDLTIKSSCVELVPFNYKTTNSIIWLFFE